MLFSHESPSRTHPFRMQFLEQNAKVFNLERIRAWLKENKSEVFILIDNMHGASRGYLEVHCMARISCCSCAWFLLFLLVVCVLVAALAGTRGNTWAEADTIVRCGLPFSKNCRKSSATSSRRSSSKRARWSSSTPTRTTASTASSPSPVPRTRPRSLPASRKPRSKDVCGLFEHQLVPESVGRCALGWRAWAGSDRWSRVYVRKEGIGGLASCESGDQHLSPWSRWPWRMSKGSSPPSSLKR